MTQNNPRVVAGTILATLAISASLITHRRNELEAYGSAIRPKHFLTDNDIRALSEADISLDTLYRLGATITPQSTFIDLGTLADIPNANPGRRR